MSHSHGFFAEDLTLMSNPCALRVLRKDVKSLGTEWSHPEVSAIGTIVPEVFSHTEESLSHEGPQPSQCCYSSEEQPRFLGPASSQEMETRQTRGRKPTNHLTNQRNLN